MSGKAAPPRDRTKLAALSDTIRDEILATSKHSRNIQDGFYISPGLLDKLTLHVAKNFMDLSGVKVPLILGIEGGKGQGKAFQCHLVYKKLGISPLSVSAVELESCNGNELPKLIRQRYREASDMIRNGYMSSLFLEDLGGGAVHVDDASEYTVNDQMVHATLVNIANNPTRVQLPGALDDERIRRVPIVATGSDFSTLYAPLIRDGQMEKFCWNLTKQDRVGICKGIFSDDDLTGEEIQVMVDQFPGQPVDFFGAVRERILEDGVQSFVDVDWAGYDDMNKRVVSPSSLRNARVPKPDMKLETVLEYCRTLVRERANAHRVQQVDSHRLLYQGEVADTEDSSVEA